MVKALIQIGTQNESAKKSSCQLVGLYFEAAAIESFCRSQPFSMRCSLEIRCFEFRFTCNYLSGFLHSKGIANILAVEMGLHRNRTQIDPDYFPLPSEMTEFT